MVSNWWFLLFVFFIVQICFVQATCPPDCGPPSPDNTNVDLDDLFEADPAQAIIETTGLEAEGVTAAEPREGGGASIESANSLTTDAGRRFENVQGAEVDADGNVVRADHVELDGNSFEEVENLEPTSGSGFSATRAQQLGSPAGSVTNGVGIASDGKERITVDSAATVSAEGITAFDAEGFVSDGGMVSVKRASRIEISDGILGTIEEFSGNEIGFDVGSARDIIIGCVSLRGIENSHVAITPGDVLIKSNSQDADFTISDCGFEQSTFQAFSEESSISVPRSADGSYEVQDGELTCRGLQASDRLATSDNAVVEYGSECFSCLQIDGVGSYWYNSEEIAQDFGLTFPADTTDYRLCLRKHSGEQLGQYDGLIDFVEQRLELAGKITYRRLLSKEGEILSLLTKPVYESLDANNKAELLLDPDFDGVTKLALQNSDPLPGVLALINNGHYQVYERFDGTQVKRFGRFADDIFPNAIQTYRSEFGPRTPTIIFDDDVMVQEGGSNGASPKVTAVCDSCSQKSAFEKEMMEQSARFPVSAGRCGT